MVANILPTDTPLTQGVGSEGQTIYFSESSHVAYQIKADDAGSNMVANILPTDTPLIQGMVSKGQTIYFFGKNNNKVCGGYTVFTFSVRPSVTFCFLNILKSHCWIFIKPCKHVHICKTNTLDKKVRDRGQFYKIHFPL